jgi:hypothetical protein
LAKGHKPRFDDFLNTVFAKESKSISKVLQEKNEAKVN